MTREDGNAEMTLSPINSLTNKYNEYENSHKEFYTRFLVNEVFMDGYFYVSEVGVK